MQPPGAKRRPIRQPLRAGPTLAYYEEAFTEPVKITAFFPDVSDVRAEVAGYLGELTQGVPNVELAIDILRSEAEAHPVC